MVWDSLLTGALGGFAATLGARVVWRWLNRPELEFDSGVVSYSASHDEEMMAWSKYKVEVRNSGGSVASNCKARVILEGSRETTERKPYVDSNGNPAFNEVPVEKRYEIELSQPWDESDSPTRIDLNRDEFARFDLFRVHSEVAPPPKGDDTDLLFSERSDEDGVWETKPVRVETVSHPEPVVDRMARLDRDEFEEIEWETKKVTVTSADADKIETQLDISWDGVIPEVQLEDQRHSNEAPRWFTRNQ